MSDNVKVVTTAYEAFANGDIPTIIGLLADDVVWTTPKVLPQGGVFKGPGEVLQFFQGIGASFSSLTLDIEAVGAVGNDLVVGIARGIGALTDGTPSEYGVVHVFTIRDGKIAAFREYDDLDEAMV